MNEPFRILLADDEAGVAVSIKLALHAPGYALETVSDGHEALKRINENPDFFDLVIADHYMPNMRAIDLVRQLRKTLFRGNIVVLSGHLSSQLKAEYQSLNVNRFLEKPFDLGEIREVIYELCSRR